MKVECSSQCTLILLFQALFVYHYTLQILHWEEATNNDHWLGHAQTDHGERFWQLQWPYSMLIHRSLCSCWSPMYCTCSCSLVCTHTVQAENLAVWQTDEPTAKLKSANVKSLILDGTHAMRSLITKQIGGCGLWALTVLVQGTRTNSWWRVVVSIQCE